MKEYTFDPSVDCAHAMDKADELAAFRNEFYIKPERIYLDGNSLGLLSKRAEQSLLDVLDTWKEYGIDGWTEGPNPWFYLSESLGEKMAPLVGARPEEVIVTGSTSVNLHQVVATFYQPSGKKTKILADELNFPSDIYVMQSQLQAKGYDPNEHLVRVKSRDGRFIEEEDIIAAMTDEIALIVLPSVLYRSGQILDMKRLTKEAHDRNILIGFDCCHSVGAIPHYFDEWGVDFAVWCNYKYVNAGPGGVGAIYVNQKHFHRVPGLAGWFSSSKEKQFDMEHVLTPATTAGAFQIGTPHLLSIAPLIGSLEIFAEAGIDRLRSKSLQLTNYMLYLIGQELDGMGFTIGNSMEEAKRGGHVFLEHAEAARICKALKDNGVIPDFRAPNGIRLAPMALYNTYEEVWNAVQILAKIMREEQYKKFENKRGVVA